ncbi:LlaJI family restriction endonuclease [Ligilactobacillus equi]|uniref:LlaJI family restriction endonuclease n=1 Tax=Ligilactobacillus equi TaxID=137357 RepID=UPI002ED297C1
MTMKQPLKIDFVQDGGKISQEIVTKYNLSGKDFKYSYSDNEETNVYYSNFVGLVRSGKDDSLLFSAPKHYMNKEKFDNLEITEKYKIIKTVTASINKDIDDTQFTRYNHSKDVVGNFAFEAYRRICDYYLTYGLYRDQENYYKKGYGSHISWKKTISRSSKYVFDGKLMMIPLVIKKKRQLTNLITECMIFTLNYTQTMYGNFIDVYRADELRDHGINQRILDNTDGIVNQLFQIKTTIFKDRENQLIDNLIIFLKRVNSKNKKIKQSIKDYNYEHVWESAVEKYLNTNFDDINKNGKLTFKSNIKRHKFKKISAHYDNQHKKRHLDPDHYHFEESTRALYLFDSKYYVKVDELNHKQLVYHFLFGNRAGTKKIYDALIVPTEGETDTEVHVEINNKFLEENNSITIYLCYLNAQKTIELYSSRNKEKYF